MEVSLIFPNHIYEFNPCINTKRKIILLEDNLYFTQMRFHKQKLVLHRATMRFYEEYLTKYGYDVEYIEFNKFKNLESIIKMLSGRGVKKIHHVETVDYRIELIITKSCREHGITRKLYDTPNFITKHDDIPSFFEGKKYSFSDFYIKQRKRTGILVDNDKPLGGKWNFDTENRKKMPENTKVPKVVFPEKNKHIFEAIDYVNKYFKDNPGNAEDFNYPVTFQSAIQFLDDFLVNRLSHFGIYQDAIVSNEVFLFHSVLTPVLNTGILSPEYTINRAIDFHSDYNYPIMSLEGFIRQVLGWREYIRAIYIQAGEKQRVSNYWNAQVKIPESFWTAGTGILPIDDIIQKVLKYGWCHHIERIMVLGNFMQLCGYHPDSVFEWFMSLFIDAYEWVTVPNVYGMSQYADGGLMSIKPYITSSSYIIKMSNYPKGDWCDIWDALYYRFIRNHRDELAQNPRMKLIVHKIDTMDVDKLDLYVKKAEEFLTKINS